MILWLYRIPLQQWEESMQTTRKRKTLQELTIKDNFMFGAVMLEEENCRQFLEMVLGFSIEKVEVDREKSMIYNPDYKGIRLDILAKDKVGTHYNVEMQAVKHKALSKRSRYYHSQMDMEFLLSGEEYDSLPNTYVIFICDFDPFGEGKYRYTLETKCRESESVVIEDGRTSIFLNTHGTNEQEESETFVKFMKYVRAELSESMDDYEDDFVRKLQQTVKKIKQSREMGVRYMSFYEMLKEERSDGKLEGRIESILELLEDLGEIPEELRDKIEEQEDIAILKVWHKLAAKSESIEQFMEQM